MANMPKPRELDKFYQQPRNNGGPVRVAVQERNPNPAPEMMDKAQIKASLDKYYGASPTAGQQVPTRY